ncbi:Ring hydroxylating enzyme beta subunit [Mycobacterium intermedium]|uniref:Ring hydroxylating enzyme beta subunit n=1 Tax=Mycobacterium intermedium TaxID=28445 RepID=A0A1E3S6M5_MYCIE|nr:nuclear transport factor 2 family protein [Mycobacterium intermedium]MCV6965663.1 nuclear transport factor 2 family protein [Mycobacterium intermedium]ODQ97750.1 Ring hydroxylating enzyme beta subunit [Mycobacterium intermedium]OPE47988.1 Ring hydroxylating enzyme beta subunit [Mycobacterium intermedium]ORA97113.1 Ring hydroxylating enzyme beta subunit [Mycobacterium intermedium]
MTDSAIAITNLIYRYAELIDGGDLDGVGKLFEHGHIYAVENGPPETVFAGHAAVRGMYEALVRIYDDGTPKTKHHTTNVQLDIDDDRETARATSYYSVTQATPELPLQIIVTGHYKDTFRRIDGVWRFDSRTMFIDQIGDLSHHLKIDPGA